MNGLKYEREKRPLDHLPDWTYRSRTRASALDDTGKIVREVKVASEPDTLLGGAKNPAHSSNGLDWKLDRCRTAGFYPMKWYAPERANGGHDLCVDNGHRSLGGCQRNRV